MRKKLLNKNEAQHLKFKIKKFKKDKSNEVIRYFKYMTKLTNVI